MVANEDDMLRSLEDGNESFRLSSLGGLIDQDLGEPELLKASVEGGNASRADDLCVLEDLILSESLEILELLVFLLIQIPLLFLLSDKVLHDSEGTMIKVLDLLMKRKVVHVAADRLS